MLPNENRAYQFGVLRERLAKATKLLEMATSDPTLGWKVGRALEIAGFSPLPHNTIEPARYLDRLEKKARKSLANGSEDAPFQTLMFLQQIHRTPDLIPLLIALLDVVGFRPDKASIVVDGTAPKGVAEPKK